MNLETARSILLMLAFIGLALLMLRKEHDRKLNWAIFFSVLYSSVAIGLSSIVCTQWGLWTFEESTPIGMPYDIYFLWVIVWGVLPVLLVANRYFVSFILLLIWLDILFMPFLDSQQLLALSSQWLWGELFLVCVVLLPAMAWAYSYYHNRFLLLRAAMQVITMILIFIFGLPLLVYHYGFLDQIDHSFDPLIFQLILILGLPALVAVLDLVIIGLGTPFPYDQTARLVRSGPYAYIRNPIQWSFALIFIPLAWHHHAPILLIGLIMSIAYSLGVADQQEDQDMQQRFGSEWATYKSAVPKWHFQWRPSGISQGTLYFDGDCHHCSRISQWFTSANLVNLNFKYAAQFPNKKLDKVCYVDQYQNQFFGTEAIAKGLDHSNLVLAGLGWFMRLPGVVHILDVIVYSMIYERHKV